MQYKRLEGGAPARQAVAERLEAIGCAVKLDGGRWLTAGSLPAPLVMPSPEKVIAQI
jgi:hypothetical protein